ncbi:MAG: DNA replication/repair protein RecF [Candidatus Cryptobacteroides sp.]
MAVLEKIVVQNFRNITLAELDFSPNLNCISGNNGEGKTNLLDAVWYLSMTKSAFSTSDRFNFRHGTDCFSIAGVYRMDNGLESRFTVSVTSGGEKRIKRDDKPYEKVSDHIGELPIVMVSPQDSALVSESGEGRRRFVNAVISQMDREYLTELQQYNRYLFQRNRLLKAQVKDTDLLSVFDDKLSAHAMPVHEARRRFVHDLCPVVAEYYGMISGDREKVSVRYVSDMDRAPLGDLLAASRERDSVLHFTSAGPQRDDIEFLMNGHPIRRYGSQGQQKSFLVALKFAQYEIMKKCYGYAPQLLLDDVFDKLDVGRIANLLHMVAGQDFGQIFISDSNKTRLAGVVEPITSDRKYYVAEGGSFKSGGEIWDDLPQ